MVWMRFLPANYRMEKTCAAAACALEGVENMFMGPKWEGGVGLAKISRERDYGGSALEALKSVENMVMGSEE